MENSNKTYNQYSTEIEARFIRQGDLAYYARYDTFYTVNNVGKVYIGTTVGLIERDLEEKVIIMENRK